MPDFKPLQNVNNLELWLSDSETVMGYRLLAIGFLGFPSVFPFTFLPEMEFFLGFLFFFVGGAFT